MESVILIIHLIIVVALVFVILLQRTSADGLAGLGGGGGAGGMGGMQVRGSANLLTKMTSFLATGFIITSLTLAYLANQTGASVVDAIDANEVTVPAAETPVVIEPEVPLAE